jgi:DNA-binding NtrC family response regulator
MSQVLFVTDHSELPEKLQHAFPELKLNFEITMDVKRILDLGTNQAVIVDVDVFAPEASILEFLEAVHDPAKFIVLLPLRLRTLEAKVRLTGVKVFHKPASTGEIGVALSKILK